MRRLVFLLAILCHWAIGLRGQGTGDDEATVRLAPPQLAETNDPIDFVLPPLVGARAESPGESPGEVVQTQTWTVQSTPTSENQSDARLDWLDDVQVGYDNGFVIASDHPIELATEDSDYVLRINGWGQLRHTATDFRSGSSDLNQFQLKRGRLVFAGNAFEPELNYFIQLDGRSSSGDDVRLLDYYLDYDVGHAQWNRPRGALVLRAGKYKVPFSMARWMSGREFQFADRSLASTFFDVNRSFAWGVHGKLHPLGRPFHWDVAIFNGLVTGGAETGSSGNLDDNFAFSLRLHTFPTGDWGPTTLADLEHHDDLATRIGFGVATTRINRSGSTEFTRLRVIDSGLRLSDLLPVDVNDYGVALFATDVSTKFRGWSTTLEYYFRTIGNFSGSQSEDLFDHGLWLQIGKFVIPHRMELVTRWSHLTGDSGTLGRQNQSAEEIAAAMVWYLRQQHCKWVTDVTYVDGAPIDSAALDLAPGNAGWLFRSQVQFSF
ncbi:porin [Crateriforma conspicua]|uniref:Phosphate-selective porin O and P n=1 Tax=Crateriforma conspicua TaxID=2527996 RepID=A0A5C6FV23_9PLAN|nr:porin [Crateriforma conspicua]TWU66231.1 hypothetical protein V7x_17920 [Crateriforma conspicua]